MLRVGTGRRSMARAPGGLSLAGQIAAMFANSEPGVWFDPSDFSTMFQDSAGTPVTAVEQPVGLLLDKSRGLVRGVEQITSQDLSNAAWVSGGAFGNWAGTTATTDTITTTGTDGARRFRFACTPGQTFEFTAGAAAKGGTATGVSINMAFGTSGAVLIGSPLAATNTGASAPLRLVGTAPATAAFCEFIVRALGASGSTGTFTTLSSKELPGNHATQATSASRPVLSARVNLLPGSEKFTEAAGANGYAPANGGVGLVPTCTNNFTSTPNGKPAARIQCNLGGGTSSSDISWVITSYTALAAEYVKKAWVKSNDGNTYQVAFDHDSSNVNVVSITPEWQLVSIAKINTAGSRTARIGLRGASGTSGTADILVGEADLRLSADTSAGPAYQRVTTATDYDTAGFKTFLRFDGVDDSLATGSINFTSTDKVTVFAGVHKVGTAAEVVAELSSISNTSNGSFGILTNLRTNTVSLRYRAVGAPTTLGDVDSPATLASPATAVLSGSLNLAVAGPQKLRTNGVATEASVDTGVAMFGNYPLYIGRRGGSSLPFNGRLYSLIVRGAASNDAQIAAAERYVNQRTGAWA